MKFEIGKKYLIRAIPYHMVGKVTGTDNFSVDFKDASYIAESGNFEKCIKTGVITESYQTGIHSVALASINDVFPWPHDLP